MEELSGNRERGVVSEVCCWWGRDVCHRWWTWMRVVVCTMIIEGMKRGKESLGA